MKQLIPTIAVHPPIDGAETTLRLWTYLRELGCYPESKDVKLAGIVRSGVARIANTAIRLSGDADIHPAERNGIVAFHQEMLLRRLERHLGDRIVAADRFDLPPRDMPKRSWFDEMNDRAYHFDRQIDDWTEKPVAFVSRILAPLGPLYERIFPDGAERIVRQAKEQRYLSGVIHAFCDDDADRIARKAGVAVFPMHADQEIPLARVYQYRAAAKPVRGPAVLGKEADIVATGDLPPAVLDAPVKPSTMVTQPRVESPAAERSVSGNALPR